MYDLRFPQTLCSPLIVNRRFGGTYRLHLYGQRNNKLSKKPACKQTACFHAGFFAQLIISLTLKMEAIFFPKRQLTINGLHGSLLSRWFLSQLIIFLP
jgi:hypothetical protein